MHHICHIHCLDHPAALRVVKNAYKYSGLFTGIKVVTLTKVTPEREIHSLVQKTMEKLGYKVFTVENSPLREVGHFFDTSLPYLLSNTTEGLLYYNHSKGVTYHPDSEDGKATSLWSDVLDYYNLEKSKTIPFKNSKYSTFGTCIIKQKNFLHPFTMGENFSYLGTNFWVRLEDLSKITFSEKKSLFYLEALPGLICNTSNAFNQGPEFKKAETPYKLKTWAEKGIHLGFPGKDKIN